MQSRAIVHQHKRSNTRFDQRSGKQLQFHDCRPFRRTTAARTQLAWLLWNIAVHFLDKRPLLLWAFSPSLDDCHGVPNSRWLLGSVALPSCGRACVLFRPGGAGSGKDSTANVKSGLEVAACIRCLCHRSAQKTLRSRSTNIGQRREALTGIEVGQKAAPSPRSIL